LYLVLLRVNFLQSQLSLGAILRFIRLHLL
jgi:hypothetical protein